MTQVQARAPAPRTSPLAGLGLGIVAVLVPVIALTAWFLATRSERFWDSWFGWLLATVGGILAVVIVLLLALAFLLYADRKIWAAVQMRKGPNVVGPFGLMQ